MTLNEDSAIYDQKFDFVFIIGGKQFVFTCNFFWRSLYITLVPS